jgi:hypothetical protein
MVPEEPWRSSRDMDEYFRPWKVYTESISAYKKNAGSNERWLKKSEDFRPFLHTVFQSVGVTEDILSKPTKCLWSTTYLCALRECELFWFPEDSLKTGSPPTRMAIRDAVSSEDDWTEIEHLATWVFNQRFFNNGFELHLGCRLTAQILQVK